MGEAFVSFSLLLCWLEFWDAENDQGRIFELFTKVGSLIRKDGFNDDL